MLEAKPKLRERKGHLWSFKNSKWSLYVLYLAAGGLLIAGGLAFHNSRPSQPSVRQEIISAGQTLVRANLAEGLRGIFAGEDETIVEPLEDNKYRVAGWVDLMTADGQQDRQNFSVILYRDPSGAWNSDRISIIPQM